MSSNDLTVEEQIARRLEVIANPLELAKEAFIIDSTTNRIIAYELWNHLVEFIKAVWANQLVILIKSKQIGISWTLALLAKHWCYRTGANVIEISSGERAAIDLLDKSRFIEDHLPKYLQQEKTHDGASLISFNNHSRIHTLPSTKDAGVGETASLVIMDENDFHEYASENYANIKPTIDAGGHMVVVSTRNPSQTDSHFIKLYTKAMAKESNFYPMFFGCFVVPGRDEEWYEKTKMDYPLEWQFTHNYPRTLEEALSPITGRSVFDTDILSKMEVRDPIERRPNTSIYFRPSVGMDYVAGADIGGGGGGDYSVLWIEGRQGLSRELCAVIRSNNVQPDTFACLAYDLLKEYLNPMIVCGARGDAYGGSFLKYLVDLQFPRSRIYCSDPKKEKLGYQETDPIQERDIFALEKTIRTGQLRIPYKPAILELMSYQFKEKKDRISPVEGAHNDIVMAMAKANFAWSLARKAPVITVSYSKTWKGG